MIDFPKIKSFLINECWFASDPNNRSVKHSFSNLNEIVDCFLLLLQYDAREEKLQETGNKIIGAISIFSNENLEIEKIKIGIESLATGFESFLKLIAELKYFENEPIKFSGDGVNYLGLVSTTLGGLLMGKVAKVDKSDTSIPQLYAPIVTFSYSSNTIDNNVYKYIKNLRNEIHITPSRTLTETLHHFRDCIAGYFFAIQENMSVIRPYVDPVFIYLKAYKNTFERQGNLFVELDSEEFGLNEYKSWTELDVLEADVVNQSNIVKQPVITAIQEHSCLWLIGEPGSGKTTSLQAYFYFETLKILSSGFIGNFKVPVIIEARLINTDNTIREFIYNITKISESSISSLLINDNIKILIDGINELPIDIQVKIQKEIETMLLEFEDASIIITSRRYGFSKILSFKVFELLPLTVEQIEMYIFKYIKDPTKASGIYDQIFQADQLIIDFSKNPMLLKMLIQVGVREQIQSNFGLLFEKFINSIFKRESEKSVQINDILKEKALSDFAYEMKIKSQRAFEQDDALFCFGTTIRNWNENISPIKLLSELLDNRILVLNSNKQISYFHELVLEYFASVKLRELCRVASAFITELAKINEWAESIIMLCCLCKDPDLLIQHFYKENIVLAARCISAGAKVSSSCRKMIYSECDGRLKSEEKLQHETVTALLELSTAESFRLVIRHLAEKQNSFTIALNRCQRPEVIATRLLEFGLTGKHRIRQCLKVFAGKPNSSSFINSTAVSEAQLILMSNDLEIEDLFLINELGISVRAFELIKEKTLEIIRDKEIRSRMFLQACILLAKIKPELQDYEDLSNRIKVGVLKLNTGNELFSIIKVLVPLYKIIDISTILNTLINKLLEKKYYKLLFLYLENFSLSLINNLDRNKFIENVVNEMAQNNKSISILEYYERYPDCVPNEVLLLGFQNCLDGQLNANSFRYFKKLEFLLTESDKSKIANMIILKSLADFKTSSLLKWVTQLNLLPFFNGMVIITRSYDDFGFAQKLDSSMTFHVRKKNKDFRKNSFLQIKHIKGEHVLKTEQGTRYPTITEYDIISP